MTTLKFSGILEPGVYSVELREVRELAEVFEATRRSGGIELRDVLRCGAKKRAWVSFDCSRVMDRAMDETRIRNTFT